MATIPVIDHIAHAHAHAWPDKARDVLRLTSEQRRWVRGRFTTSAGREIALALPTGTVLAPGAVLYIGEDWYLAVEAAPEPVLRIHAPERATAVRYAFEVGNRHFQIAIDGDDLLVADDTAMVQLLDRLGAAWRRDTAVFQPVGQGHKHEH